MLFRATSEARSKYLLPAVNPALPSHTQQPELPQTFLSTAPVQQALSTAKPLWQIKKVPIPLYFNPQKPWQQHLLQQTLSEWSEASLGLLTFATPLPFALNEPSAAQGIRLLWQVEPPENLPFQVGRARNTLNEQGFITQSELVLIENPAIDQHLSKEQQISRLRSTLLHELGHALGLEHSLYSDHVMYFRGWRNTLLAKGDVLALQQLYKPVSQNT